MISLFAGILFSMPLLKTDAQQEKSTGQDLEVEYKDAVKQTSCVEGEKVDTARLGYNKSFCFCTNTGRAHN